MKNHFVRFVMFFFAVLLTVVIPVLIFDRIAASCWIGIGFMLPAEALVFLPSAKWRNAGFPIRLPLLLFVFPGYFVLTLAAALFSYLLTWRQMLAVELLLAFPVLISVCIAVLTGKTEEDMR